MAITLLERPSKNASALSNTTAYSPCKLHWPTVWQGQEQLEFYWSAPGTTVASPRWSHFFGTLGDAGVRARVQECVALVGGTHDPPPAAEGVCTLHRLRAR